MNNVWILVCDASKARLFELRGSNPAWNAVELVTHAASRSKASDLVSDHSGTRSAEGGGVHHNALAPASSPKEVEKDHFAHELAGTLDQALRAGRFRWWVLVAPPEFVGRMKKELTSELEKHLMTTVAKDLNHLDVTELAERLADAVRVPLIDQVGPREAKRAH